MINKMFNFYKLIVAGGRDFDDYQLLSNKLTEIRDIILDENLADDLLIVSGAARGADKLGEEWARKNHVGIKQFPADWDRYGKSAGYKRNKEMAEYGDALLAFWDGKSRGTGHMINLAKEHEINVFLVKY